MTRANARRSWIGSKRCAVSRIRRGIDLLRSRKGQLFAAAHLRGEAANTVFIEEVTQGAHGHLQQLGSFCLVAGRFSESLDDVGLFEVVEVAHKIEAGIREVELRIYTLRVVIRYVIGQLFGLDLVGPLESDRPLDGVFQFANIAVPSVIFEDLHSLWRDR